MKLRLFTESDSPVICGWIKDEESLYRWSADRINHFPLSGDELAEFYAPQLKNGTSIPLTATDDTGKVIGHINLRYPDAEDKENIRFGFVIVDAAMRKRGLGREMLEQALAYAKELGAKKASLGVFEDNESAKKCYLSAGFEFTGEAWEFDLPVGKRKCLEMVRELGVIAAGNSCDALKAGIKEEECDLILSAEGLLAAFGQEGGDLRNINPLVLAHVGDAVFELIVRTVLARTMNTQVQKIHKKCTSLVNCHAQCELMHKIEPRLNNEELSVYKRARNAKSYTIPKNASPAEYRTATGFEALAGWLYLEGKTKRLIDILKTAEIF